MFMETQQKFQHPTRNVVVAGPMEGAPMELVTQYETVESEAAELREKRERLDESRKRIEGLGPEDELARIDGETVYKEEVRVLLAEELKFRQGPLSDYLEARYAAQHQLNSEASDNHVKLKAKILKGLEKLGFDTSDPRQAGLVLYHPEVKTARIASATPDDAQRRENREAIERLTTAIQRIRVKGIAI